MTYLESESDFNVVINSASDSSESANLPLNLNLNLNVVQCL